ncbi:hypothetical protein D777_00271 [Marinobacter nitratireducens]|uniref:Uncharacterized protein n=1 Tax=Marinobacter nitratireducens TaxID=1137280 RepID=A0A072MWX8_9GAMM|nr:hypothetical protein D777_00271 [Marinobacter nitratireducens]
MHPHDGSFSGGNHPQPLLPVTTEFRSTATIPPEADKNKGQK